MQAYTVQDPKQTLTIEELIAEIPFAWRAQDWCRAIRQLDALASSCLGADDHFRFHTALTHTGRRYLENWKQRRANELYLS